MSTAESEEKCRRSPTARIGLSKGLSKLDRKREKAGGEKKAGSFWFLPELAGSAEMTIEIVCTQPVLTLTTPPFFSPSGNRGEALVQAPQAIMVRDQLDS